MKISMRKTTHLNSTAIYYNNLYNSMKVIEHDPDNIINLIHERSKLKSAYPPHIETDNPNKKHIDLSWWSAFSCLDDMNGTFGIIEKFTSSLFANRTSVDFRNFDFCKLSLDIYPNLNQFLEAINSYIVSKPYDISKIKVIRIMLLSTTYFVYNSMHIESFRLYSDTKYLIRSIINTSCFPTPLFSNMLQQSIQLTNINTVHTNNENFNKLYKELYLQIVSELYFATKHFEPGSSEKLDIEEKMIEYKDLYLSMIDGRLEDIYTYKFIGKDLYVVDNIERIRVLYRLVYKENKKLVDSFLTMCRTNYHSILLDYLTTESFDILIYMKKFEKIKINNLQLYDFILAVYLIFANIKTTDLADIKNTFNYFYQHGTESIDNHIDGKSKTIMNSISENILGVYGDHSKILSNEIIQLYFNTSGSENRVLNFIFKILKILNKRDFLLFEEDSKFMSLQFFLFMNILFSFWEYIYLILIENNKNRSKIKKYLKMLNRIIFKTLDQNKKYNKNILSFIFFYSRNVNFLNTVPAFRDKNLFENMLNYMIIKSKRKITILDTVYLSSDLIRKYILKYPQKFGINPNHLVSMLMENFNPDDIYDLESLENNFIKFKKSKEKIQSSISPKMIENCKNILNKEISKFQSCERNKPKGLLNYKLKYSISKSKINMLIVLLYENFEENFKYLEKILIHHSGLEKQIEFFIGEIIKYEILDLFLNDVNPKFIYKVISITGKKLMVKFTDSEIISFIWLYLNKDESNLDRLKLFNSIIYKLATIPTNNLSKLEMIEFKKYLSNSICRAPLNYRIYDLENSTEIFTTRNDFTDSLYDFIIKKELESTRFYFITKLHGGGYVGHYMEKIRELYVNALLRNIRKRELK